MPQAEASSRPPEPASEVSPIVQPVRRGAVTLWLVLVDLMGLLAAGLVLSPDWSSAAIFGGCTVLLMAAGGHYSDALHLSVLDEVPSFAARVLVATAVTYLVTDMFEERMSPGAVVAYVVLAWTGRAAAYTVVRHRRRRCKQGRPTILVGSGPVARTLVTVLQKHPEYGRRLAGFVDDERRALGDVPYLGQVTTLPALLQANPACEVIVADPTTPEPSLIATLQRCDTAPGDIFVVPRMPELHSSDPTSSVWGYPLVKLRRAARRSVAWRCKRMMDVAAATLLLFLCWPVLLLCALAVRLEGGRGVIFKQERVGIDDRRFEIWKLRSLPATKLDSAQRWSITGDAGIGPVGRLLRTSSLDELPQLWNVIRGDMSMVGPRPERPFYVEEFSRKHWHYAARHRAPAGLTGLAQVNGLRGDTDISERARFDNRYITDWSLWEDAKIILRTAWRFAAKAG